MFRRFRRSALRVFPTRSIYEFDDSHVHVKMTFMTAALPSDLDVLSRPLSYITWEVHSVDGKRACRLALRQHQFAACRQFAESEGRLVAADDGKAHRPARRHGRSADARSAGDDTRIDWGYVYAAAPTDKSKSAIGASEALLKQFVETRRSSRGR